jgi:preprotein translocase subunit YajC
MHLLLAQTGDAAGGSSLLSFLPLLLIGAFIWFAMIRPQRKRQQAVQDMQKQLSVGADVITIGGIHGRVDAIGDATVDLELTDDVVVRFKRSAIAEIVTDVPAVEAEDTEATETTE